MEGDGRPLSHRSEPEIGASDAAVPEAAGVIKKSARRPALRHAAAVFAQKQNHKSEPESAHIGKEGSVAYDLHRSI